MSAAVIILGVKCNYCGKHRSPRQVHDWGGGVKICESCYEWHHHALAVLGGAFPKGCQGCGVTYEELEKRGDGGYVDMTIHGPVDGIYQVFCLECSEKLRPKQRERYHGTEFGHRQGLG